MSERSHDDGKCCENGYFGTQHNCMKQQSDDKKPREFHISDDGPEDWIKRLNRHDDLGVTGVIHVIEYSAYAAAQSEIAKMNSDRLCTYKVDGARLFDMTQERDQLKVEIAQWKWNCGEIKAELEKTQAKFKENPFHEYKVNADLTRENAALKAAHSLAHEQLAKQEAEIARLSSEVRSWEDFVERGRE